MLHSAITRPPSVNARFIQSRHLFVPAAQQLISSSTTTYVRHSGRITDGMRRCLKTLRDSVLPSPTPTSILLE